MSNIPKRKRRPDKTYPKTITLTEFGRSKIEAWAEENHINFSAAIEALALMGLDDERSIYAVPLMRATTLQGLQLTFNRIAKLLSAMATEAAISRSVSESILLQMIRETATQHPNDFETIMRVDRGSNVRINQRIRKFHDAIKESVETVALRRLKKPLVRLHALFAEQEEDAA